MDVTCAEYEKKAHVTKRCVWPFQPKPLMQAVGLGHPDLGFFVAQYARTSKEEDGPSTLGLIRVMSGGLDADGLKRGLALQFKGEMNSQVSEKGSDFVVIFPDADKVELLIGFEEFKLKGTKTYIMVEKAVDDAYARWRLWTVWARATGVPKEMAHFKGICELGAMIGAIDNVDMQLMHDQQVVRFLVDVRTIKPFPLCLEFYIKPNLYMVQFLIESVVTPGTIPEEENNVSVKRPAETADNNTSVEDARD